ncbi:glycosyl hydrolase family 61-domain-containing protein [Whalleya microplaca]|nr:glycosyl hydrolase family 61-domain-containing protein [Whalleya microplaca]
MKYMALVASFCAIVEAHGVFSTVFIDGKNQGDGKCLRTSFTTDNITSPITNLDSPELACGIVGQTPAPDTCAVKPGDKVSFEFRLWASGSPPGTLDASHLGPMAIYAKKVRDTSDDPTGGGWFKLWEDGHDDSTQKWATDELIANDGIVSVQMPSSLPSGNYLVRPEIIALHNLAAGPAQFYVGCAQISIDAGASKPLDIPAAYEVSIPGYIKASDPSVNFNSNPDAPKHFPYPMPGPQMYKFPGGSQGMSRVAFEPLNDGTAPDPNPTTTATGTPPTATIEHGPGNGSSPGGSKIQSVDGTCGGDGGFSCEGSPWGNCCSPKNWCGSSLDYCGMGCQSAFGTCRRR